MYVYKLVLDYKEFIYFSYFHLLKLIKRSFYINRSMPNLEINF